MEHQQALQNVLYAVDVFSKNASSEPEKIISIFTRDIENEIHANKLYCFVPMAFGFVLAKRMGIEKFPSEYYLLNQNNEKMLFPLSNEHYFTAALTLAYETFEHGWSEQLSKESYEAVIAHSAEINALNRALNSGVNVSGSEFKPSTVYGVLAELNT
ncbi:MAG: hypothetical protein RSA22_08480 [Acinetobacter sp.]